MNAINMKDLLAQSLNKTGKQDQVVSSLVWKYLIEEVKELKKIDISSYIISIKVKENTLIVKTSKPILNSELLQIQDFLTSRIHEKLGKIGIHKKNLKIRFQ